MIYVLLLNLIAAMPEKIMKKNRCKLHLQNFHWVISVPKVSLEWGLKLNRQIFVAYLIWHNILRKIQMKNISWIIKIKVLFLMNQINKVLWVIAQKMRNWNNNKSIFKSIKMIIKIKKFINKRKTLKNLKSQLNFEIKFFLVLKLRIYSLFKTINITLKMKMKDKFLVFADCFDVKINYFEL